MWVLDSRTQAIRGDNPFHAEVQGVLAALTSLPYPVSSVDDVTAAAWGFLQAAGVPGGRALPCCISRAGS